jgi:hypothetical protein
VTTDYRFTEKARPRPKGGWLHLSSEMTHAAEWPSGRRDLVVAIAPGLGGEMGHACFIPDQYRIEINADKTGITEAEAGGLRPDWNWGDREAIAGTWGLLTHEAAHAAHTKWPAKVLPSLRRNPHKWLPAFEAAKLLEEVRIEKRQADRRWWDVRWLRMSASRHMLDDIDVAGISDTLAAARVLTLVGGRVRAGILEEAEARPVIDRATAILGESLADQLMGSLIPRVLHVQDGDSDSMMELGQDWVNLFGSPNGNADDAAIILIIAGGDPYGDDGEGGDQDGAGGGGGEGEEGEEGEEDGAGGGDGEDAGQPGDGDGEKADQPGGKGSDKTPAMQEIIKAISEMTDKIDKDGGVMAIGYTGRKADFSPKWDAVTSDQKTAAAALARRLREWFLPERSTARHDRAQPPGRLNMREAMRGDAQRYAGQVPDVTPWRHISRKMVETPPLRVGIAVDVSGSMAGLSSHSRELSYRLTTAFSALPDARVRTVMAGEGTALWTQKPGKMPHFSYGHGEQNIHLAIEDLAERLALYRRGNARLLIIISDGGFNMIERNETVRQLQNLIRSGCRVLWLDFARNSWYYGGKEGVDYRPDAAKVPGVDYIGLDGTPDEVCKMAETELVRLLTSGLKSVAAV